MTQRVLITGAGRGIGAAIAQKFIGAGYCCILVDLDLGAWQEPEKQDSTRLLLETDISQAQNCEQLAAQVMATYGGVDILVNNAGIGGPFHRIDQVSEAEWDGIFAANLKSAFFLCKWALPVMKIQGFGRIINMASAQGLRGASQSSTYSASKHALIGLTRSLAAEWGPFQITCNAVCPGYIDTQMGIQTQHSRDHLDKVLRQTPTGTIGKPQDVAEVVYLLAQPSASYINGAAWVIDGGMGPCLML